MIEGTLDRPASLENALVSEWGSAVVIRRKSVGFCVFGIITVLVFTFLVVYLPSQVSILLLGVLAALVAHKRSSVLVFVVVLIPTLSLVRRIAAGETAYQEADPLILLPLVLIIGVVAISWTNARTDRRTDVTRFFALASISGVAIAVVLSGAFSVNAIFYGGLIAVPLLLAIVTSTGQLPDVWPKTARVIPWIAVAVGIYGTLQFFALPEWDSAWMISSQLTSIGHPYPQQVRVFGASESPGPYALFMGLSLTITLGMVVLTKGRSKKFGWISVSAAIALPLLLSGVRSALLGVVVCVALLALARARGFARIILVVFLIGGYQLLKIFIGRFGGQSTILSADRYSNFSNDSSLLARLDLLHYLSNPSQYLIGNATAPSVDNLYIDVMLRYGLMPAAGLLALFILVAVRAFRLLRCHQNETAALCVWFLLTQSFFGNIFNSLVGILVGIILGTVMWTRHESLSIPRAAERVTRSRIVQKH